MSKTFRLNADDLQPLAENRGMCIATSLVTVDGQAVGHMSREASAFPNDSGWRFTAGTEGDGYGDDPDHWDVVDVNLIANIDVEITMFLDEPEGSAFVRWPLTAALRPVAEVQAAAAAEGAAAGPGSHDALDGAAGGTLGADGTDGDESTDGEQPQALQRQALDRDWWIDLPGAYTGFLSNGALHLVSVNRPPRRIWVDIRKAAEGGKPGIAALMTKDIRMAAKPSGAVEYDEAGTDADEHRIAYWFEEHREGESTRGYWTLYTYTIRDASFVQAAFLSTAPDPDWALAAWRSMRYEPGTGQDWENPDPTEDM